MKTLLIFSGIITIFFALLNIIKIISDKKVSRFSAVTGWFCVILYTLFTIIFK